MTTSPVIPAKAGIHAPYGTGQFCHKNPQARSTTLLTALCSTVGTQQPGRADAQLAQQPGRAQAEAGRADAYGGTGTGAVGGNDG